MHATSAPLVTRRPVYDDRGGVFGYELVSSDGLGDASAAARAVMHGVVSGSFDGLVPQGRLVLPVSASLLDGQLVSLLPAERVAVKLPGGLPAEPTVTAVLADLRARGGLTVLGEAAAGDADALLLAEVDMLAVDLSGASRPAPRGWSAAGLPLLAEGIGDPEAFDLARRLGCRYFQGTVFVGTAVTSATPPGFRPAHLALLQAVSRPELDYAEIERATKQDVQLTHACLRYLNSAAFGWRRRIESLSHAFVLLGERGVRSWATLVVLADLAADRPQPVAVTAAVRARFCELLGGRVGVRASALHLFTLGMFSLIDALTGRPMREALDGLPLDDDVREALLGGDNELRAVLDAVTAYEAADWALLREALVVLGADEAGLLEHYLAAVDWSAQVFDPAVGG